MIFAPRRPEHWSNYGCLTTNLATMTGLSDAQEEAYLAVLKSAYNPAIAPISWVRFTRYGIAATTSTPDWNTTSTRYYSRMYQFPTASDIMTGRKLMFEPLLWIRQVQTNPFTLNPCPSPNYFGRSIPGGTPILDSQNTWRTDIRTVLDHMLWSDVGTTGGEPYVSGAKTTNFNILLLLGPNEIDAWTNARLFYLADGETSSTAPQTATRAEVTNLAGSTGLNTLLLRIYDHCRHSYDWCREKRPDVGVLAPSVIQIANSAGTREFTIYNLLQFSHSGAGLTAQGAINDVCDAHQIHPHMRQDRIPDPWASSVPPTDSIVAYHYWQAAAGVRASRAAAGLPDNTRPLLSTETGQDYIGSGAVTTGRTDLFQLRRLKYGLLVLGELYYGVCQVNFYACGRSSSTGFNTVDPADDTTYWGSLGQRDADFAVTALDPRETSDDISFIAKSWTDYWKDWQVWFNQQQDPIDGGSTVCPFVEWNRVAMSSGIVTMSAGGRNLLARRKKLRRGEHTFKAEIQLTGTGSQAALRVSGQDKLNGLNLISSSTVSGPTAWTPVEVRFTPRQHNNRRIPDPAYAVLLIDHNGVGTCEVRSPVIVMPGVVATNFFDIVIDSISISPAAPVVGDQITFSATIRNTGNTASPSGVIHGLAFVVDDNALLKVWSDNVTTSLAPGASRTQTANGGVSSAFWTATSAGSHTVIATFDDINRMPAEQNKSNNTMLRSFTVAPGVSSNAPPPALAKGLTTKFFEDDFTELSFYHSGTVTPPPPPPPTGQVTIDDITMNPATPQPGATATIGAIINNGTASRISGGTCAFVLNGTTIASVALPAISAGAKATVTTQWTAVRGQAVISATLNNVTFG